MNEPQKSRLISVRQLADDVVASIADLLRVRSMRKEAATMFRDSRLMRWLATEARAIVRDGIEPDPWSAQEVDALADRIRTAVVADRSGVRRLPGKPKCVARSEIHLEHGATSEESPAEAVPWVQLATAAGVGREIWDEDCETWISVPADLPKGRYVALNVKGESMLPLLHDDDVVLVNMSAAPRAGDIVLARTIEGYVVKRLVRVSPMGVDLESFNPEFRPITIRDQSRPIVGVVVLRWCEHEASVSTNGIR